MRMALIMDASNVMCPSIRSIRGHCRAHLVPTSLSDMSLCSAITHGISHLVGHVAVGTLADLVLWKPENFGTKPEMVLKSGVIVWAQVKLVFPLGCCR